MHVSRVLYFKFKRISPTHRDYRLVNSRSRAPITGQQINRCDFKVDQCLGMHAMARKLLINKCDHRVCVCVCRHDAFFSLACSFLSPVSCDDRFFVRSPLFPPISVSVHPYLLLTLLSLVSNIRYSVEMQHCPVCLFSLVSTQNVGYIVQYRFHPH